MRRFLTFAVVSTALLVAGCSAPPLPEVTFFANGRTVGVEPAQYCKPRAQQCEEHPDAPASLRVPAGKPLVISVPSEVADAPWLAVFRFRAADGSQQEGRTQVFPAGSQHAYTLTMPTAADQLTEVQVQRIGSVMGDPTQGITFATDGSWVLAVEA